MDIPELSPQNFGRGSGGHGQTVLNALSSLPATFKAVGAAPLETFPCLGFIGAIISCLSSYLFNLFQHVLWRTFLSPSKFCTGFIGLSLLSPPLPPLYFIPG